MTLPRERKKLCGNSLKTKDGLICFSVKNTVKKLKDEKFLF